MGLSSVIISRKSSCFAIQTYTYIHTYIRSRGAGTMLKLLRDRARIRVCEGKGKRGK